MKVFTVQIFASLIFHFLENCIACSAGALLKLNLSIFNWSTSISWNSVGRPNTAARL